MIWRSERYNLYVILNRRSARAVRVSPLSHPDIRYANLIGRFDIEVLFQLILGHDRWLAVAVRSTAITHLCPQTLLLDQAIEPMLAASLANSTQVMSELAITIDTTAFQAGLLDQAQQSLITLLAKRRWHRLPGVITTGMKPSGAIQSNPTCIQFTLCL